MGLLRSLIVKMLALWKGRSLKQVAARAGFSQARLSNMLGSGLGDDDHYERLLAAVEAQPAEVWAMTECLERLAALGAQRELTIEEREAVERWAVEVARLLRAAFTEAVLRSREEPPADAYPRPGEVEPARWRAGVLLAILKERPAPHRLAVVKVARQFQTWALAERCCEESVDAASRDLDEAVHWAEVAREIAREVQGPEGWRRAVRGWVEGHPANVLRVKGKLEEARAGMEEAKRLWQAGSDPDQVLDPGRLLDLEASLRRAERRFDEALELLDRARGVSRIPARILIKKGFTLEVMGEYERAVEALLEAEPRLDRESEPRLWYKLHANLCVVYTHTRRYREAAELAEDCRRMAVELGDEIDLPDQPRFTQIEPPAIQISGRSMQISKRARQIRPDLPSPSPEIGISGPDLIRSPKLQGISPSWQGKSGQICLRRVSK
jgi:lambda repressor-like predicted transcriptional regulator